MARHIAVQYDRAAVSRGRALRVAPEEGALTVFWFGAFAGSRLLAIRWMFALRARRRR